MARPIKSTLNRQYNQADNKAVYLRQISATAKNLMATAKQMLTLIKSHVHGDNERFYSLALQLAASEARLGHHAVAEELRILLDEAKAAKKPQLVSRGPVSAPKSYEELLDKALFRRFDAIFKYHLPTKDLIISAFQSRLSIFSTDEVHWQEVAEKGAGLSQADIVGAAEDAARNAILSRAAPIVRTSDLMDAIESRKSIV